jgi:hypothetical protein
MYIVVERKLSNSGFPRGNAQIYTYEVNEFPTFGLLEGFIKTRPMANLTVYEGKKLEVALKLEVKDLTTSTIEATFENTLEEDCDHNWEVLRGDRNEMVKKCGYCEKEVVL